MDSAERWQSESFGCVCLLCISDLVLEFGGCFLFLFFCSGNKKSVQQSPFFGFRFKTRQPPVLERRSHQLSRLTEASFLSFFKQRSKTFASSRLVSVRICCFSLSRMTVNKNSFGVSVCWLDKRYHPESSFRALGKRDEHSCKRSVIFFQG